MRNKKRAVRVIAVTAVVLAAIILPASGIIGKTLPALSSPGSVKETSSTAAQNFYDRASKWIKDVDVPDTLHMVNADDGWLMSGRGIFRTGNGGKTWQNVSSDFWDKIGNLNSKRPCVSFADADHAYLAFSAEKDQSPEISFYATSDGGRNWTAQTLDIQKFAPDVSSETYGCSDLSFIDASRGKMFVSLDAGAGSADFLLLDTQNGGNTWTALSKQVILPDGSLSFRFSDANNGFVFITGSAYLDAVSVTTKNGGLTWGKPVTFPVHYTSPLPPVLSPVLISPEKKIVLLSCQNGKTPLGDSSSNVSGGSLSFFNVFYDLKSDGTSQNQKAELVTDLPLLEKTVSFPGNSTGFVLADINGTASLYRYTAKSGKFQKLSHMNWMRHVIQLQFLDSSTGFCLTANTVYRTADGGKHWHSASI